MVAWNKINVWEKVFNFPEYKAYHLAIQTGNYVEALNLNMILTIRTLYAFLGTFGEEREMRREQVRALQASGKNLRDKILEEMK